MQIYYYHNDEYGIFGIMSIKEILPITYTGDRPALLFTYKGNYHSAMEKEYPKIDYLELNYYRRFYPEYFKLNAKTIPEDKEALKQAFDYLFK